MDWIDFWTLSWSWHHLVLNSAHKGAPQFLFTFVTELPVRFCLMVTWVHVFQVLRYFQSQKLEIKKLSGPDPVWTWSWCIWLWSWSWCIWPCLTLALALVLFGPSLGVSDTDLNYSLTWPPQGTCVIHHTEGQACVETTWFVLLWACLQTFSNHLYQFLPADGIH